VPPKNKLKVRKREAASEGDPGAQDRTDRIYALVAKAERFYRQKRYRKALGICAKLEATDPANMTAEQMRDGCQRELRKRKAIALGLALGLALLALALLAISSRFLRARHRVEPPPGTLRIQERQTLTFRLGSRADLEYVWELRDDKGTLVAERQKKEDFEQRPGAPWEWSYTPAYNLVKASNNGEPVKRRVRAYAFGPSGDVKHSAEWTIEVSNLPLPPTIVRSACDPPATLLDPDGQHGDLLMVVAGTGTRTFRVEATDGDGGTDLLYEWLVNGRPVYQGTEPFWTYCPGADVLPADKTGRERNWDSLLRIACRVTNHYGDPRAESIEWNLRPVRSNRPPQLIAFDPELPAVCHFQEGEERRVTVTIYDPDEGDARLAKFNWELDRATISRGPSCPLKFGHDAADREKPHTLRLTVTDPSGARAERTWQILVTEAPSPPRPASPTPSLP